MITDIQSILFDMQRMYKYYLFCFFLIVVIIPFCCVAQNNNRLIIKGQATIKNNEDKKIVIQVFQDGVKSDEYNIDESGLYSINLSYNHEFILLFVSQGCYSQRYVINTSVPQDISMRAKNFFPFSINVCLFPVIKGIDSSFSDKTVMRVFYNEDENSFISELYYNNAQIQHLIEEAVLVAQQKGKDSDLKALKENRRIEFLKEYNKLIKEAEAEYNNEEFLKALDGYMAASKLFPKEQYPKDRIQEINDLLGLIMVAEDRQQARIDRLNGLLKSADELFNRQLFDDSKNKYRRVLSIDPQNVSAKERIREIDEIIEEDKINREYDGIIEQADNSFSELLYIAAREQYLKAKKLKPEEHYTQQKIEEIDGILKKQAKNAEKFKSYDESVFQGEVYFEKQFYEKAIACYKNALIYKPDDKVATNRIREINGLMQKLADRTLYNKRIKTADRAFRRKQYNVAIIDYQVANSLFPEEMYPKSRIDKINNIFAEKNREKTKSEEEEKIRLQQENERLEKEINERNELYARIIRDADNLAGNDKYIEAQNKYIEASKVKPQEKYPNERIEQIKFLILKQRTQQREYDAAIILADDRYKNNKYKLAKESYLIATNLKPTDFYPQRQIEKIDSILQEEAVRLAKDKVNEQLRLAKLKKERERRYNIEIIHADSLFRLMDYKQALLSYKNAIDIKSEEKYPRQKITIIEEIINQLAIKEQERKRIDYEYDSKIRLAEKYYASKNYEGARKEYKLAAQIKPKELYVYNKILILDSLVNQQINNKKYKNILLASDGYYRANAWNEAKRGYEKAFKLKPEEKYPKEQIDKIDALLLAQNDDISKNINSNKRDNQKNKLENNQKQPQDKIISNEEGLKKLYTEYIKKADDLFLEKRYNVSRAWYYRALDVIPHQEYPKERISEINILVKNMLISQRDRDYQKFINLADSTLRCDQLAVARGWYYRALSVKKNQQYPLEQLKIIEHLVKMRMEEKSGEIFRENLKNGDEFYQKGDYNLARFYYKRALELRPDNDSARKGVEKIEEKLK